MKKDPYSWTKLYHAQDLNDSRKVAWTAEQVGWFWSLKLYALCQEPQGTLPTDDATLAAIARRARKFEKPRWDAVLACFVKKKGRLMLEEVVAEIRAKRKKSQQTSKAAKSRWRPQTKESEETVLWRGIAWPEWALKKLRFEVASEADGLKVEIDSLPQLAHTNAKKAALIKADKAVYQADLTIMNATLKSIDAVLAAPAVHRGPGKVKIEWQGKEHFPSELVEKIAQNRAIKACFASPLAANGNLQTLCAEKDLLLAREKRSIFEALQVVERQTELNFRQSKQPSAPRSVAVAVPGKSKKGRELPPEVERDLAALREGLAA